MKRKKIALVLSGCGNKDGSEVTEAVSLIVGLSRGADLDFFAPNRTFTAKNFLTNESIGERNMMLESARITRSKIADLTTLESQNYDGLAFPGGYGAATQLCDWASKGATCAVLPEVQKAIEEFHRRELPIAAVCIAPVLLARVLGKHRISVTIGDDAETIQQIAKTGAIHELCPVNDFITDRTHKIITTPAYMYGGSAFHQVFDGIQGLAKEFLEMA